MPTYADAVTMVRHCAEAAARMMNASQNDDGEPDCCCEAVYCAITLLRVEMEQYETEEPINVPSISNA
jgi:hypothetical protein